MLDIPGQMCFTLNRRALEPHLKYLVLHLDLEEIRFCFTAHLPQLNQLPIVARNDIKQCIK